MNELMRFTRETTLELAKIQREKLIQQAINFVGRLSGEAFLEIENSKIKENKSNGDLEAVVTKILADKLNHLLKDVDWRIRTAADKSAKVSAENLNLKSHLLTGFTVTDNSPVAGSIAWASCHIVYQGTDVTITDGDSDLKYIWWDYDASPNTVFQESADKPTLTDDDVLVFINEDGTHHTVMSKMPPGAFLLGTSISALELGTNAVTTIKIADAAVEAAKLGALAVETAKINDLAVTEGKLGAGAVTNAKIGDGVIATSKLNLLAHMLY